MNRGRSGQGVKVELNLHGTAELTGRNDANEIPRGLGQTRRKNFSKRKKKKKRDAAVIKSIHAYFVAYFEEKRRYVSPPSYSVFCSKIASSFLPVER